MTDVDEQFTRRRARKAPVIRGTVLRSGAGGLEYGAGIREWRVVESVFWIALAMAVQSAREQEPSELLLSGWYFFVINESFQNLPFLFIIIYKSIKNKLTEVCCRFSLHHNRNDYEAIKGVFGSEQAGLHASPEFHLLLEVEFDEKVTRMNVQ